jgi:hypothetical protein
MMWGAQFEVGQQQEALVSCMCAATQLRGRGKAISTMLNALTSVLMLLLMLMITIA